MDLATGIADTTARPHEETDARVHPMVRDMWALSSLRAAERLFVWGLRQMRLERGPCPQMVREFTRFCGDEGAEALIAYHTLIRLLARSGRHPLAVGELSFPRLTHDERQLLSLLAAAQANDAVRLEAHLRWLVTGAARQRIDAACRLIGEILTRHGQLLPLPESEAVLLIGNDPCMMRVH